MADSEFDTAALDRAERLIDADFISRVAGACRGSGNPAHLAWLADGLKLGRSTRVVDLGSGLGGPAAWIQRRYGSVVMTLEPAQGAVRGQQLLFDIPVVQGDATRSPFAPGSFDVVMLLGVASVVAQPDHLFAEAARLAQRLAFLDYVSTERGPVFAGGSRFHTAERFRHLAECTGWHIEQMASFTAPTPITWTESGDDGSDDDSNDGSDATPTEDRLRALQLQESEQDESEVRDAIEGERLVPCLFTASRDTGT